jgi:hypothetical protein
MFLLRFWCLVEIFVMQCNAVFEHFSTKNYIDDLFLVHGIGP